MLTKKIVKVLKYALKTLNVAKNIYNKGYGTENNSENQIKISTSKYAKICNIKVRI